MATWNQGINSGGFLGDIGKANSNAPRATDANTALSLIRENNDIQRSGANNPVLQGLQGLYGVAQMYQADQQAQRQSDFLQKYGAARAEGDVSSMRQLFAEFPEMNEQIGKGMEGISTDTRQSLGNVAANFRMAVNAGAGDQFVAKNAAELMRLGIDPKEAQRLAKADPKGAVELADTIGMSALTPEKYFDVIGANEGRQIDREKLAETVRSNQAGEALTARRDEQSNARGWAGISIQQQNANIARERLNLDRELKAMESQEKLLDRRLARETNELKRTELEQKLDDVRTKKEEARNEKVNAAAGRVADLNSALSVGHELGSIVNEHPTAVSRNQGGILGNFWNLTDDTKTLAAKTDEYNLKVILPALRGTFGGNPTEGERTALMQSQNALKTATSNDDFLKELNKAQNTIVNMQKRQIKDLGIPVTKSSDEETDIKMLLTDESLINEYVRAHGYLPEGYYKAKLEGKK